MGKLTIFALCLIGLFVGAAIAATVVQYYYPSTVTVVPAVLEVTLDGVPLLNGTAMDWEECVQGGIETWGVLSVKNIGESTVTVSVTTDLVEGVTVEWTADGSTLATDDIVTGDLTITINPTVEVGIIPFSMWITAANGT